MRYHLRLRPLPPSPRGRIVAYVCASCPARDAAYADQPLPGWVLVQAHPDAERRVWACPRCNSGWTR